MSELDAERREALAATIGRDPADHSPNCWDGSPCRYCTDLADALAPLVAGWLADAWDAGVRFCWDDFEPYDLKFNPYRGGDDD